MKFTAPPLWILVTAAFLILIGAWTALIMVATKNRAQVIEVPATYETLK